MVHRIPASEDEMLTIQNSARPVKMEMDDDGYEVGDYTYFLLLDHDEELTWLIVRKIINVCREADCVQSGCCILTVQ